MAEYYATYIIKGKYIDKQSISNNLISYTTIGRTGFKLIDFLAFADRVIKNKKIKLVFIIIDATFSPVSFAGLEEIRYQIEKIQKNGIDVYMYAPSYNLSTLYLSAGVEKVFIHPIGNVCFSGFYKRNFSAAPLLKNIGIQFTTIKTGIYKDTFLPFGDTVAENNFSKLLLEDFRNEFIQQMKKKKSSQSIYEILSGKAFLSANIAKKLEIVDEIASLSEIFSQIAEKGHKLKKIKYSLKNRKYFLKKRVAIVYINGEIVAGNSSLENISKKTINSNKIIHIISYLQRKKSIDAVLFRINSTGGSSSAAYDIYRAIKEISKYKLTVVSIGNYATSAAYWIALGAKIIFANSTSVLGAIGVVTARPNFSELFSNIGVEVTTDKLENTAVANYFEECSEETNEEMKTYLDEVLIYYKDAINEHCGIDNDWLDNISQGQTFSGKYAINNGLIDKIGGIEQALEYIKSQFSGSEVTYLHYPENKIPFFIKKIYNIREV